VIETAEYTGGDMASVIHRMWHEYRCTQEMTLIPLHKESFAQKVTPFPLHTEDDTDTIICGLHCI